ncbi:MAG: hypothetical protein AUH72_17650 [Acidobacteria bacterium 13_1_40CM_4_65_8]|nr:MAG: hypothetical protein AUH72_17650 [Acidobacteria bacterium 13_1_40CM_4_65_8]
MLPMTRAFIVVGVIVVALLVMVLLQPVCVPLSNDDLKSFNVPIEQRTDRDIYLRVFQQRDGRWYQCKTRLSRLMFF